MGELSDFPDGGDVMSIKDLLALADDKLKDVFSKVEYDPAKDRARHAAAIDKDAASFTNGATRGKRQWKAGNNVVEYTSRFPIQGKTTHYIPSNMFSDFLSKLKALVSDGTFDKDFEAAQAGDAEKTTRAPRAKREGGGAGWSEERRQRFAASIAARKAAKGA